MASLQARHQRTCKLGRPWTTFADAKDCGCSPLYHVVHRVDGKLIRDPAGHSRKEAERALDSRKGDIARRVYHFLEDISFDAWADRWIDGHTGKENTKRVYRDTIRYAKTAFGKKKVRDLQVADVKRMLDLVRTTNQQRTRKGKPVPREVSAATLARHLRTLSACLGAAVAEQYADRNVTKDLHKSQRPRPEKSKPAYFTDAELSRLWPELADRPMYFALVKTAVVSGMRFAELAALEWGDVDLLEGELHVRRQYTDGRVTSPKGNEARVVDLTPQAVGVLEAWYAESGGGDGLVFEAEPGGYVSNSYVRRVLYSAMKRAGIPRAGEHGRHRDVHSLRHTFARLVLEHGAPIDWVRRQLGHSSITLTVDTYGEWSRSAQKAEAGRLAGAFPV